MDIATLEALRREKIGTRAARAVRKAGRIPAIIYGHGETPEPISLGAHDLQLALTHGARTLQLTLGEKKTQYLIKSVQYDHLDQHPIHVDLARVSLDERVKVQVQIELKGVPKGVGEGGILDQIINDIEIECTMMQIPDSLRLVVSDLGLDEALCVKDLDMPEGVVALPDPDLKIVVVRTPAEVAEEEPAEAEEGEPSTEPERIGRVREEDAGDKPSSA